MSIDFVQLKDFTYGEVDQLSPLIRRVICENPGPFTYTGSGTYLVGRDDVAIIDPGPANPAHTEALMRAVGAGKVSHILVTHTHTDHCGGVADLKALCGAPVYAFGPHPSQPDTSAPALDEGADHSFRPDILMADGDEVTSENWTLRALHTPGHISNHLCFALPEENALFSGDHMMGWATTVVAAPDGNMVDYLNSLDLLLGREEDIYYPTHGAPIPNPRPFVRAVKVHRQMRDRQILEKIGDQETAIMDIVAQVYRDIDKRLHYAAAMNVHAHLERHVASGKVIRSEDGMFQSRYRLAG